MATFRKGDILVANGPDFSEGWDLTRDAKYTALADSSDDEFLRQETVLVQDDLEVWAHKVTKFNLYAPQAIDSEIDALVRLRDEAKRLGYRLVKDAVDE